MRLLRLLAAIHLAPIRIHSPSCSHPVKNLCFSRLRLHRLSGVLCGLGIKEPEQMPK
jgi:hypothetical protein